MQKKLGVIDIGTNTFHLLIVTWDAQAIHFEPLVRKRIFVKLGAKNLKFISPDAYKRGIEALIHFKYLLDENDCTNYKAIGTAAIRNASNAADFCKEAKEKTGINITKISGDLEAALIHKGIKLSYPFNEKKCLIMDIGGGSVEFIIANHKKVFYAHSFLIGVAVLHNQFHQVDPIPKVQISALHNHLETTLAPLFDHLYSFNPGILIGSSGTFDVLENVLPTQQVSPTSNEVQLNKLPSFTLDVIPKNLSQRKDIEGIPDSRADLIVVALLLIEFICQKHKFDQLVVSQYSLKEGMLYEMMQGQD